MSENYLIAYRGEVFEVPVEIYNMDPYAHMWYIEALYAQQVLKSQKLADPDDAVEPFYFTQEELDEMLSDQAKDEKLLEQFEEMLNGFDGSSSSIGISQIDIDEFTTASWDEYNSEYGIWLPNQYEAPKKPKCECGTLAIDKDAKPWQHATYCPLYEKKRE